MNKRLQVQTDWGEFLVFVGAWFLLATSEGAKRHDYWSSLDVSPFVGAPFRLNAFMARDRFDNLLSSLVFTNDKPPSYKDPFFPIEQLVCAWNKNMSQEFSPGWVTCLDESMSPWYSQFSCPGFMFVPRKPWPFGNEWHTIACGISKVLFRVELVQGKDFPKEKPDPEFNSLGKTVGLLLRLTRSIELAKKGVFASALIKKRRYWPKFIPGDAIKTHCSAFEVGHADALGGTLDGIDFDVFTMREPDYTMMLMSTYGTTTRLGDEKIRCWFQGDEKLVKTFQYPEVVHNHFQYRHIVDDHNAKRHSPISLEMSWATKWWPNRVFAFLLAITEINVYACKEFVFEKQLVLRRDLDST